MATETKIKKFNKDSDTLKQCIGNKNSSFKKDDFILKYQKLITRNKNVNKIDLGKESLKIPKNNLKDIKFDQIKKNLDNLNRNNAKLPFYPKISSYKKNTAINNMPSLKNKQKSFSFYDNFRTCYESDKIDLKLSKDKSNKSFEGFNDYSIRNLSANTYSVYELDKTANFSYVNMTENCIVSEEKNSQCHTSICIIGNGNKLKKIEDFSKDDSEGFTFRLKRNFKIQKNIPMYKSYLAKSRITPAAKNLEKKIKPMQDNKLFNMKLKDAGVKIAVNAKKNETEKKIKVFIPQFTFSENKVETFTGKETEADSFTSSKKQSQSNFKSESIRNMNSVNTIETLNSLKCLNDSFQSKGNSPKIMKNHPIMKRFFDN